MNWLKNLFGTKDKINITVDGVNPQTENEFRFFKFVETEPVFFLQKWFDQSKRLGHEFKPQYERAIQEKLRTGEFRNPHKFPEYFNSEFDFIAIDFETANNNRISACAIGLAFVKNDTFVHKDKFFISPPEAEVILQSHYQIHGISKEDLEFALDFKDLWEIEFSKYFNSSLIVFHNASMDLSILKNLFLHYKIEDFNIRYLDTMRLAEKSGKPRKLTDLADEFEINIKNHHDPLDDAVVCAHVFNELIELYPNYFQLIQNLNPDSLIKKEIRSHQKISLEIKNENIDIIKDYLISKNELEDLKIEGAAFLFTGELTQDRDEGKEFILNNGGLIKQTISSKVDYVVLGEGYGWSKIQKIKELNEFKNCKIKILSNSDFKKLESRY
ncbi:exonuclease domain-containing protein [Algoriphagus formosus]|uniref:exonuclease domain-containing protein n=1 Tax=Algoriphagus formosus TaxID=2007308 RepID=UPI000C293FF0|nr:exonuclease domain-containing protein [Algoriphagus formosus]